MAQLQLQPQSQPQLHHIPSGSWTFYIHDPEKTQTVWDKSAYTNLAEASTFEGIGVILRELGENKIINLLVRIMLLDTPPLWEDARNIRGGSYCLKVRRSNAINVFERYVVAVCLGKCSKNSENTIVGITISPKSHFCIIKIWNKDASRFNSASDIELLFNPDEEAKDSGIIYRASTDQRI